MGVEGISEKKKDADIILITIFAVWKEKNIRAFKGVEENGFDLIKNRWF